jgi:amidohydrolase
VSPSPAEPSADREPLRAALTEALEGELPAAIELRHELHRGAELSGAESGTAAAVAAALGHAGALAVAGTGRLIRIGPATGPSVAVRAELDALPITEQTGVAWASGTQAMHACGHDVHLAALVAFGRAAAACDHALPAALLAVLQPREEASPSGAREIASSAELRAHRPAAIIGVHLQHQLPARTVAAAAGTINAATDDFEITVTGIGGHAGYPHLAADPVLALCQTVVSLQQLVSRRIDPTHAAVVAVGSLRAGTAPNVIPEIATAGGTMRTLAAADRDFLRAALADMVDSVCRAHGCRGSVTITPHEPALVNDARLTAACRPLLLRAGFTVDAAFRSCGADDFSYYCGVLPAVMLFLGSGTEVSLHSPRFLPADDTVGQVAAVILAGYLAALDLAADPPALMPG